MTGKETSKPGREVGYIVRTAGKVVESDAVAKVPESPDTSQLGLRDKAYKKAQDDPPPAKNRGRHV